MDYSAISTSVSKYLKTKQNTLDYREEWKSSTKQMIIDTLKGIVDNTDLEAEIDVKDDIENLEVIMLNLGRNKSGIREKIDGEDYRTVVRNNGILVYQQLFNGKIVVLIIQPFLEGYGEPQPPKSLEILRPSELKQAFIFRHVEELLKELTNWEDYDDDQPTHPPIGFNHNFNLTDEIQT